MAPPPLPLPVAPGRHPSSLHGDVRAIGLPELFEFLGMQRLSGSLKIRSGPDCITVVLYAGMIGHAQATCKTPPGDRPSPARSFGGEIFELLELALGWQGAQFSFQRDDGARAPDAVVDPREAMLRLMQARDEAARSESTIDLTESDVVELGDTDVSELDPVG
jgi:hypothetical protein